MLSFDKRLKFHDSTLRFSISTTDSGWEVREQRDSHVVKTAHYQDWHRVERVRRAIAIELDRLQRQGWASD